MATRQVTFDRRGFTLAEMMTVVAIAGCLAALSVSAYSESQKIGRVNAQARLLVQRLQNVRTQAVSQGAAQGYHIGINGLHVAGIAGGEPLDPGLDTSAPTHVPQAVEPRSELG